MMNRYLYLSPEGLPESSESWPCWCWGTNEALHYAPLAEQGRRLGGAPVHVLLPAELGSHFHSDPWPTRRQPTLAALSYALEEQLGEPLEHLRLFHGAADAMRRYPVWVVQGARYDHLRALLNACNLVPTAIYVDADLLSRQGPGLVWLAGRWLLGGANAERVALSEQNLTVLRARLPVGLTGLRDTERDFDPCLLHLPAEQAVDWLPRAPLWRRLVSFGPARPGPPWRCLAGSIALLALLAWTFIGLRTDFLLGRAAQLHQTNLERFSTIWPQRSVHDLAAELNRSRPPPSRTAGRADELARLADIVLANGGVQARRIEWQPGDGWRLGLLADSLADLERLTRRSAQMGLDITLGSAALEGSRVSAVLTWNGGES